MKKRNILGGSQFSYIYIAVILNLSSFFLFLSIIARHLGHQFLLHLLVPNHVLNEHLTLLSLSGSPWNLDSLLCEPCFEHSRTGAEQVQLVQPQSFDPFKHVLLCGCGQGHILGD